MQSPFDVRWNDHLNSLGNGWCGDRRLGRGTASTSNTSSPCGALTLRKQPEPVAGAKNMAAKPIISGGLLILAEKTAQFNKRMRGSRSVDPRIRAISASHGLSIDTDGPVPAFDLDDGKISEDGGRFVRSGNREKAYLADLGLYLSAAPRQRRVIQTNGTKALS